jgi:hypothetical protein
VQKIPLDSCRARPLNSGLTTWFYNREYAAFVTRHRGKACDDSWFFGV